MGQKFHTLILVTSDTLVAPGPCVLYSLSLAANGEDVNCDVRSGHNINAERKAFLFAKDGTTEILGIRGPVIFPFGIFINVGSANALTMIEYLPISQAELRSLTFYEYLLAVLPL